MPVLAYQSPSGPLETLPEILQFSGPVAVTLDGQPVREVPGPEGLPAVGNYYEIYPDHLGNHNRLFQKYGPVLVTNNMGRQTYLTNDPAVGLLAFSESQYFTKKINKNHPLFGLKDNTAIFLGDTETANWQLAHKYLPPAMSPKAIRHYTPLMQRTARESFPVFDDLDRRGETWNVYQYMLKLASQTIGKFALDIDLGHFASTDAPLHSLVSDIAHSLALNKKVTSRGDWYARLPFGDPALLREIRARMYAALAESVDKALKNPVTALPLHDAAVEATCVIDYLLRAVDGQGEKLPLDLVYSNMVVVTGAGFTTTSSLLSWLLYCVVTYPGNQERLLQELVDYGVNNETTWTPELANGLPFLDKFVKETQRLHNPSYQPGRTTKKEVIIPGGYRLPEDAVLIPAIHAIHTNPNLWDNPQHFDPDRWDTEAVKNRPQGSYVPFGTGPRGCIGFNLALAEVKILLPELVYRYEFTRQGTDTIEYDPEFQLIRPINLYVRAKRRTEYPVANPKKI